MPNKETNRFMEWLWRANQILIPMLVAFGIFVTQKLQDLDRRTASLEQWRLEHLKWAQEQVSAEDKARQAADEALRVRVLREIESNAAIQRESILSQLGSISRDVIRLSTYVELRSMKEPTAFKPQNTEPSLFIK